MLANSKKSKILPDLSAVREGFAHHDGNAIYGVENLCLMADLSAALMLNRMRDCITGLLSISRNTDFYRQKV